MLNSVENEKFETRLGKLLLMLGSPNENEAHVALRKVNAILLNHGKDWHWVIDSMGQALTKAERQWLEQERTWARQQADMVRQRPADAETQKAASYVLSKGTEKRMHPDNVATYKSAAAGGMVRGIDVEMIMQSAANWRGRDMAALDKEYRASRANPFWLAEWLLRANSPDKPFSIMDKVFIDYVIATQAVEPDDIERLAKLERRVLRQRPWWNQRIIEEQHS